MVSLPGKKCKSLAGQPTLERAEKQILETITWKLQLTLTFRRND